jgi:RNA polymerase sigma-70 factor, ECF subfamily
VSAVTAHQGGHGARLLALYDRALPQVYGYLVRRVGDAPTAEDLTSETFMAAVTAIERGVVDDVEVAWLVGIARHKLADHWRRVAREDRGLRVVAGEVAVAGEVDDPWDAHLDARAAQATLARLGAHHRGALVLRYVDGLPVKQVAELLHRTEHATEALLVRARKAFREQYEASATGGAVGGGGTDA